MYQGCSNKTQYHLSLLYRPKATNKVNQTMIFFSYKFSFIANEQRLLKSVKDW